MKPYLLIILFIILLFLAGCDIIVCDKPYIRHEAGCCLDTNDNKICDEEDKSLPETVTGDIKNETSLIEDEPYQEVSDETDVGEPILEENKSETEETIPEGQETESAVTNDQDNDRIPDDLDSNPYGQSGHRVQKVWQDIRCINTQIGVSSTIDRDWYYYRKNLSRGDFTPKDYVDVYDPMVQDIAKVLKSKTDPDEGRLEYELAACFITGSGIGKGEGFIKPCEGYDKYPKFPIETIIEGGDCEDISILLSSIIQAMGIGTSLLYIEGYDKNHPDIVGTGIWCDTCSGLYYRGSGATRSERKKYSYLGPCGNFELGTVFFNYANQRAEVIEI